MTEVEWRACTDPQQMLECLRGKASPRKLRLFAVACCRQQDALAYATGKAPGRPAVDLAEQFADGLASENDRQRAWRKEYRRRTADASRPCTFYVLAPDAFDAARQTARAAYLLHEEYEGSKAAERLLQAQCGLLREVFGDPFSPPRLDALPRTPTVTTLAQALYQQRAFDRLPILADALEDAGCTNEDLLGHLRGAGPHVCGCWALDLVLGKG